jgi:hypothetical protein
VMEAEKQEKIEAFKQKIEMEKGERLKRIREYWENLPRFEKPEDVPAIPKVDTKEYQEFYVPKLLAAGAIPKRDLVDGQYYLGEHRRARIGKWNAEKSVFEYWRYKFGFRMDECNHFEDDDGFALFVPLRLATQEEFDASGKN